jgi:hypothetical protein
MQLTWLFTKNFTLNAKEDYLPHINWHLSKAHSPLDLSDEHDWRADPKVGPGGYFVHPSTGTSTTYQLGDGSYLGADWNSSDGFCPSYLGYRVI